MFKKILALLLATMMVLGGMVTVAAEEAEAPAEEVVYDYTAAAESLAALDILKGNGVDYALDDYVQRWHMALFVARIMSGETKDEFWNAVADNTTKFDDVDNFFGAIDFVSERGIVKGKGWIPGVGSNCFDPYGDIILQDALTMVVRALGFKQLENYPDDFVAKAEALGLTAGLEELDLTAPLTRGQMVQILNNTLFTEIDGTSFAKANFGLEEQTYVVVATEFQALLGTEKVDRIDYEGLSTPVKYVALAPLNADGTYDFANLVYFTEAELGLAYGESEQMLAYSYVIKSFDGFAEIASIEPTAYETFYNFGDDAAQMEIVAGTKYAGQVAGKVKIDGITYQLVDAYTKLTNKDSYTLKNPELIIHSMFKADADELTQYSFLYDLQGNILDPNSVAEDGSLNIGIFYTAWNNTYYVKKDGGFKLADDADFKACAIGVTSEAPQYGIVDNAADLTTIKFSEITMIDDDNDGDYDRAIYIPYSVGQYTTTNLTDDVKGYAMSDYALSNNKNQKNIVRINGQNLTFWYYDANYKLVEYKSKNTSTSVLNFTDGKPANKDYIVYYYNPYSRDFTVVENLGQPDTGVLTNFKQTKVELVEVTDVDGNKSLEFKVTAGEVTIDGETYTVGYSDAYSQQQYTKDKKGDFTSIDATVNNGNVDYLDVVYDVLLNNKNHEVKYLTLAGHVILLTEVEPYYSSEWLVFDYGYSVEDIDGAFKTYDYYGDILGVDEDGYIHVNAYDSAYKTGDRTEVMIDKINGQSFGLLVEDYAILQYQFSGVGFVTDINALETMKKIVIKNFFKTLTADLNGNDDRIDEKDAKRQLLFRVSDVNDGVYDIYTDVDYYWGNNISTLNQPKALGPNEAVKFNEGYSLTKVATNIIGEKAATARLVLNASSKIVLAATDGITVLNGTAVKNATINFQFANAYCISDNLILLVSKTHTAAQLVTGATWNENVVGSGWTYYLVTSASAVDSYATKNNNGINVTEVTYGGLYDIKAGAAKKVTVPNGGLPRFSVNPYLGLDYAKLTAEVPVGAIYANKGDKWVELTADIAAVAGKAGTFMKYIDSELVLSELLRYGYVYDGVEYIAVFDEMATYAKGDYAQMIKLDGVNKFDTVKFVYDAITYDDTAKTVTFNNDKDSTWNKAGTIYFDYTKGVSFKGILVVNGAKAVDTTPAPEAPVLTLQDAKNAATTAVTAAAGTTYASIANAWNVKINDALTIAEVNALKAAALAKIADAKKADEDAADELTKAINAAVAAAEKAAEGYMDFDYVAAQVASTSAWLKTQTDVDTLKAITAKFEDAAVNTTIEEKVAQAKAEIDAIPTCEMENDGAETIITMTNIPSTANWLYVYAEGEIAGLWTENVIKVHLASDAVTVPADPTAPVVADWVRNGDDATISIKYADGFQNSKNVLEAGTYYVVITHDGAADQVFEKVVLD